MNISPIKHQVVKATKNIPIDSVNSANKVLLAKIQPDSFNFAVKNSKTINFAKKIGNFLKGTLSSVSDLYTRKYFPPTTEITPFVKIDGCDFQVKKMVNKNPNSKFWFVSELKDSENNVRTIFKDGTTFISGNLKNKKILVNTTNPKNLQFGNICFDNVVIKDLLDGKDYKMPNARVGKNDSFSFEDIIKFKKY